MVIRVGINGFGRTGRASGLRNAKSSEWRSWRSMISGHRRHLLACSHNEWGYANRLAELTATVGTAPTV